MKIYLAALADREFLKDIVKKDIAVLDSFYYLKKNNWITKKLKKNFFENFLLDSGAFTFMSNKDRKVNWVEYVDEYINFINENNIESFFELDIDSLVGLKKVEKLRNYLEKKTNKQSIPVWHKSRGEQYFIDMCKKYNYVAIGGIVSKEIKKRDYKYFPWFIDTAHKYNAKIHGLGLTNMKAMKKYNFDSVDSTSWKGSRWGTVYNFNGKTIKSHSRKNQKTISYKKVGRHNFKEWVKFQKYADKKL